MIENAPPAPRYEDQVNDPEKFKLDFDAWQAWLAGVPQRASSVASELAATEGFEPSS